MGPESPVVWALTLSSAHACFFNCLDFSVSFILSPFIFSPDDTPNLVSAPKGGVHTGQEMLPITVDISGPAQSFPPSPHLPSQGGRTWCQGGSPRRSSGSSDSKSRSRAQLPTPVPLPRAHLPLGLGSITPQDVMDSPGTFKGLHICLQCRP